MARPVSLIGCHVKRVVRNTDITEDGLPVVVPPGHYIVTDDQGGQFRFTEAELRVARTYRAPKAPLIPVPEV